MGSRGGAGDPGGLSSPFLEEELLFRHDGSGWPGPRRGLESPFEHALGGRNDAGGPEFKAEWKSQGNFQSGTLTTRPDKGESRVSVSAFCFPGSKTEVALVFAGVHGTETQGVEVAKQLVDTLKAAASSSPARRPAFTTIIIPELFAPSRRPAKRGATGVCKEEKRCVTDELTKQRVEPNRNFPQPAEDYAEARKRGKKDELLACNGKPLKGDGLIPYMLPETRILVQLIEQQKPLRAASLHAKSLSTVARGAGPGIFVDPRGGFNPCNDRPLTAEGRSDEELTFRMLKEAMKLARDEMLKLDPRKFSLRDYDGQNHPFSGNLLDAKGKLPSTPTQTVHYTSTAHPPGTSFGMWAPAATKNRPAVFTVTVEFPRYGTKLVKVNPALVTAHASVLARQFLGLM